VNPEINASDAFVAAWLPGTEGGGVADVLVGDAAGRPRTDFTGSLSFAWPASAAPAAPGPGAGRAILYPDGYGLRYADRDPAPRLPEISGVDAAQSNFANYLVHGRTLAPWSWQLAAAGAAPSGAGGDTPVPAVALRAVDADGLQEGGRELRWPGGAARAAISGPAFDMRMLSNGEAALRIGLRVDEAPDAPVSLGVGCGPGCEGAVDITEFLKSAPPGQWRTLKVKLSCFGAAGTDVSRVATPFALSSAGHLRITLSNVQLVSDPAGAVCPRR